MLQAQSPGQQSQRCGFWRWLHSKSSTFVTDGLTTWWYYRDVTKFAEEEPGHWSVSFRILSMASYSLVFSVSTLLGCHKASSFPPSYPSTTFLPHRRVPKHWGPADQAAKPLNSVQNKVFLLSYFSQELCHSNRKLSTTICMCKISFMLDYKAQGGRDFCPVL